MGGVSVSNRTDGQGRGTRIRAGDPSGGIGWRRIGKLRRGSTRQILIRGAYFEPRINGIKIRDVKTEHDQVAKTGKMRTSKGRLNGLDKKEKNNNITIFMDG